MRKIVFGILLIGALSSWGAPKRKAKVAPVPEPPTLEQVMLERVQRITVVDSLAVPAVDFFRYYKVPASAGRLLEPGKIPFESGRDASSMAFESERGNMMMFCMPDTAGKYRIVETERLLDGTYTDPQMTPRELGEGGDSDFPWLAPDGTTLYYASDGEGSLGGYDIFVTTRDPQSGEYLAPANVGYPFNSDSDDYLMVIDEENGVGWWATDRNHLEGMVTIYVYLLEDERENVEGTEEERREAARIANYKATWPEGEERQIATLAAKLRKIIPGNREKEGGLAIPLPGGGMLTDIGQLRTQKEQQIIRDYITQRATAQAERQRLDQLRRTFAKAPNATLGGQIASLERETEKTRARLTLLLSNFYAERKRRN